MSACFIFLAALRLKVGFVYSRPIVRDRSEKSKAWRGVQRGCDLYTQQLKCQGLLIPFSKFYKHVNLSHFLRKIGYLVMAKVPAHLLLLSPPPWPPSHEALRAAYHDALTSTLQQIAGQIRTATVGAGLDIAATVPLLHEYPDAIRSSLYPPIQALVAGIYKLICVIAARERINVEDTEGIDVRVLLVAHPRNQSDSKSDPAITGDIPGPVITLKTLVQSQREWRSVFAMEGEQGEKLLREFITSQDSRVKIQRVSGGPVQKSADESISDDRSRKLHTAIAVGGTWDHIHIGHKLLLTMFAFLAQPRQSGQTVLTIGITGDELLKNKKYAELLESWHERQLSIRNFLIQILDFRPISEAIFKEQEIFNPGPNGHAVLFEMNSKLVFNLVEINDPFGPTITDEEISALIVSGETRSGGKAVNDKRAEKGWHNLEVFEVDVLDPTEATQGTSTTESAFEAKLSSTAVRQALSERGRLRSKA